MATIDRGAVASLDGDQGSWVPLAGAALAFALAIGIGVSALMQAWGVSHSLTRHMAGHILAMNALAPLVALALLKVSGPAPASGLVLAVASASQIGLLWLWHTPALLASTALSPAFGVAMMTTLLASALLFWLAVLGERGASRWRPMLALVVTGKLFCLLGAILTFAPQPLYPLFCYGGSDLATALADQQAAGLLMLAACPITYVLAGVYIAARWLNELGD